jgi:hypothetical protein
MTAAAQAFDTFLPFWRASIPPSIPLAYFDAFVAAHAADARDHRRRDSSSAARRGATRRCRPNR